MKKNDIELQMMLFKKYRKDSVIKDLLKNYNVNSIDELPDSNVDEVYLQIEQIRDDLEIC